MFEIPSQIYETAANENSDTLYLKESILWPLNMSSNEVALCSRLLAFPHILVAVVTEASPALADSGLRALHLKIWSAKHCQSFWGVHPLKRASLEEIEVHDFLISKLLDEIDEAEYIGPPSRARAGGKRLSTQM